MNKAAENRSMGRRLVVFALAMFGFGFALVPFYRVICEVTGINFFVKPDEAPENTQVDTTRLVTVEFDANIRGMPWKFAPQQRSVQVHPGQLIHAVFEVSNPSSRAMAGQAIPSYGPKVAASHVRKLECFCFSKQVLEPGETRQMPVVFVLDPSLPKEVGTVTLSYTFFEQEGVVEPAKAPGRAG
jgi:cytochrome c oxidase assembly protein subunit 11